VHVVRCGDGRKEHCWTQSALAGSAIKRDGRRLISRKHSAFSAGKERAHSHDMKEPVRRHEDLIAWQLCHQLRALVLKYTRTGPAAHDYEYRYQLRKAVRSACYNTSEGFYRYKRRQSRHQMNVAFGSLGEALDQLDEGRQENYFTAAQHTEMRRLCLRAIKCNAALRRSWDNTPPPPGA
jgi:four helix bundle protein